MLYSSLTTHDYIKKGTKTDDTRKKHHIIMCKIIVKNLVQMQFKCTKLFFTE